MYSFPSQLTDIYKRIHKIDPIAYAKTRNYGSGAVTQLGPYISRGVVSSKHIWTILKERGLAWEATEKLLQELAWRDYWQLVWKHKGNAIFNDLKSEQRPILHHQLPSCLISGSTGIDAVDQCIHSLLKTGYMHNHMRMYVASIACNIGRAHWLQAARWMYAHLLDGDLASNHLSWQWVAGSNSNKKYYANQANINRFFDSQQRGTFLDVSYDEIDKQELPEVLKKREDFALETQLPETEKVELVQNKPTLIYNYYNLDPHWHKDDDFQRILLLEPSVFETHPVSDKCIQFCLDLAKNIEGIKVYVGEFAALEQELASAQITYKEHPLNASYQGKEEPRDWLTNIDGYFPSFFSYWKKAKKQLR